MAKETEWFRAWEWNLRAADRSTHTIRAYMTRGGDFRIEVKRKDGKFYANGGTLNALEGTTPSSAAPDGCCRGGEVPGSGLVELALSFTGVPVRTLTDEEMKIREAERELKSSGTLPEWRSTAPKRISGRSTSSQRGGRASAKLSGPGVSVESRTLRDSWNLAKRQSGRVSRADRSNSRPGPGPSGGSSPKSRTANPSWSSQARESAPGGSAML